MYKSTPLSSIGHIIRDIMSLALMLSFCSFLHARGRANRNRAAHQMAHLQPFEYSTRVWV